MCMKGINRFIESLIFEVVFVSTEFRKSKTSLMKNNFAPVGLHRKGRRKAHRPRTYIDPSYRLKQVSSFLIF